LTQMKTLSKLVTVAVSHAIALVIAQPNPTTASAVIIFHSTTELILGIELMLCCSMGPNFRCSGRAEARR